MLTTIREFDALGRDQFLQKYGYGSATEYFLVFNGKKYDSKAIAGVAVGKQFPARGPMRNNEFTGGLNSVVSKLRQLGFEVTTEAARITAEDIKLLRESRRHARYADLSVEERTAYERLSTSLKRLGDIVVEELGGSQVYTNKPTSGFHLQSGVRGGLPKDLWFAVHRRDNTITFAGNPQLYGIASERGLEIGFGACTHPSDFSNADIKEKVRKVAPSIFALLPQPGSVEARALSEELSSGGWRFCKKQRLEAGRSDFDTFLNWLKFLKSPEGLQNAGGTICRYFGEAQLNQVDLEEEVRKMTNTFRCLMEKVKLANVEAETPVANLEFGDLLAKALGELRTCRQKPFEEMEPLWSLMKGATEALARTRPVRVRPEMIVKWSVGKGGWNKVPWVAILNRNVTTSTQRGLYCVFLISEDLQRLYLTLNQGMTSAVLDQGRSLAMEELTKRAVTFRALVPELKDAGFTLGADINLGADGWRGKNYAPTTIGFVEFTADNFPSDAALEKLMEPLLLAYDKLVQSEVTGSPTVLREDEYDVIDQETHPLETSDDHAIESYTLEDALDGLFISKSEFLRILNVWTSKKNLVLQGAPGVGKSFVARRLAYALLGAKDESRIASVQFHQSYGYEDFVQGYRPTAEGGFELRDGIFYRFCRRALTDQKRPYVFIIDEINRGNLSKILGELMLLIERDKREPAWATQLANSRDSDGKFYVPPNLHIIGMMNTADRSLSVVDYALRRRFAFIGLQPEFSSPQFRLELSKRGVPDSVTNRIVEKMNQLNEAIASDHANLGSGFCIGHSFFVPTETAGQDPDWYTRIIETEIRPLLDEYWFDERSTADTWCEKLRS